MANTVSAAYAMTVSAVETLATDVAGNEGINSTNNTVLHNAFNISGTLTAATTPPVTTVASFTQALAGGTATIDLNALPGTNASTISLVGLKIQLIIIKSVAANANTIAFAPHGTHPYLLFGTGNEIDLMPGQQIMMFGNDAAPDVALDSADQFLVTGTGSQELDIIIVAG